MNKLNFLLVMLLAASVSVLSGCKKNQTAGDSPPPMMVEGVNVELPKLMQSLEAAKATGTRNQVSQVLMSLRYGQYDKARADLEKIAVGSGRDDDQKKLATEVVAQLQQVVSTAGAVRK